MLLRELLESPIEALSANVDVPSKDHDIRIGGRCIEGLKLNMDVAEDVPLHQPDLTLS